jgi:hypothetical protein
MLLLFQYTASNELLVLLLLVLVLLVAKRDKKRAVVTRGFHYFCIPPVLYMRAIAVNN